MVMATIYPTKRGPKHEDPGRFHCFSRGIDPAADDDDKQVPGAIVEFATGVVQFFALEDIRFTTGNMEDTDTGTGTGTDTGTDTGQRCKKCGAKHCHPNRVTYGPEPWWKCQSCRQEMRLPSPPTVTDVGTNTQPIALISVGAEDREIYFEEGDTQESINARIRAAVDEMSKGCEVTITLDDKEGHWIDDDKDPDPLF